LRVSDPGFCGRFARRALGIVIAASLIAGCALTVDQERDLGAQFSRQVAGQMPVVHDPEVLGYVRGIGQRLVAASGPQPFAITWNVVQDPNINAFAGPGGFIYVHTGLLQKARSSSEVAAVMSHELAHVTLRHVSSAVARQQQSALLGAGIAAVTDSSAAGQIAGLGAGVYNLRYNRQAERDADRVGVVVLQKAGFDPQGMVSIFQLLGSSGGGGKGGFLSSHPGTAERIAEIQGYISGLPRTASARRDDGGLPSIQTRLRTVRGTVDRSAGRYDPYGNRNADGYRGDDRYDPYARDRYDPYDRNGGGYGGGYERYGGGGVDPNGYPEGSYDPYDPYGDRYGR
jgi:predicted Zn-dependent protease